MPGGEVRRGRGRGQAEEEEGEKGGVGQGVAGEGWRGCKMGIVRRGGGGKGTGERIRRGDARQEMGEGEKRGRIEE